jgi:transposase-like protein
MWTLTYSVEGKRCVEFVPDELLPRIAPLAKAGADYRNALSEILTINAQLLTMWRKQVRERRKAARKKGHR